MAPSSGIPRRQGASSAQVRSVSDTHAAQPSNGHASPSTPRSTSFTGQGSAAAKSEADVNRATKKKRSSSISRLARPSIRSLRMIFGGGASNKKSSHNVSQSVSIPASPAPVMHAQVPRPKSMVVNSTTSTAATPAVSATSSLPTRRRSILPPEPNYASQANQVQRPSVDSVLAFYTSPSPSRIPQRSSSPLPPIPTSFQDDPESLRGAVSSLPSQTRKLAHRVSSDFVRPDNEPPLATMRTDDARAQLLKRRSMRTTTDPTATSIELKNVAQENRDSVSPMSAATTRKLSKDDMAYRRHSIAHHSTAAGDDIDKQVESCSGKSIDRRSMPGTYGTASAGGGQDFSVPHNPPPFLRANSSEVHRILRPAIRIAGMTTTSASGNASGSSLRKSDVQAIPTGSRLLGPIHTALATAHQHGDAIGQIDSGSPILIEPAERGPPPVLGHQRRASATSLRSLRKASLENGDVEAEHEINERAERRRSRSRKSQSEGWSDQLDAMLHPQSALDSAPLPPLHQPSSPGNRNAYQRRTLSSPINPPGSPLEELISDLGGRRASHSSSLDETSTPSRFSSRGSTAPTSVDPNLDLEGRRESEPQMRLDKVGPPVGLQITTSDAAEAHARETIPTPEPRATDYETAPEDIGESDREIEDKTRKSSTARPLTLDEMEREIVRMESELALNGHRLDPGESPAPSYTSSMLAAHDIPTTSPLKTSTSAPMERSVSESSASTALSEITPRTARQWSMGEMERAYDRMRGLLGSTRSFALSELDLSAMGEDAFKNPIPEPGSLPDGDDMSRLLGPDALARSSSRASQRSVSSSVSSLRRRSAPARYVDKPMSPAHDMLADDGMEVLDDDAGMSPTRAARNRADNARTRSQHHDFRTSRIAVRRGSATADRSAQANGVLRDVFDEDLSAEIRDDAAASTRQSDPLIRRGTDGSLDLNNMNASETASDAGSATSGQKSPAPRTSSRLSSSGALRSNAGRDLQKWMSPGADDASDQSLIIATEVASSARRGSRVSSPPVRVVRKLSSDSGGPSGRFEARPLSLVARRADSSTWYPATPNRAAHRQSTGSMKLDESANDTNGGKQQTVNVSAIRGMDKLEIYFKYTAAKSDLEKAELEREALYDALYESRAALADVRHQRDALEADRAGSTSANAFLRKIFGPDEELHAEKLEALVHDRLHWEDQARKSMQELERLRYELSNTQAHLTRIESRHMSPIASSSGSATIHGSPRVRGSRLGSSPRQSASSRVGSPSVFMDEQAVISSAIRGRRASSPSSNESHDESPATTSPHPVWRPGAMSDASSTLSRGNFASLVEQGTPLVDQTIQFGPKSSYGSVSSPLKARTPAAEGSNVFHAGILPPAFTDKSLPPIEHRLSHASTMSSEYGDHLPNPPERDWNPSGSTGSTSNGLKEDDLRFLTARSDES